MKNILIALSLLLFQFSARSQNENHQYAGSNHFTGNHNLNGKWALTKIGDATVNQNDFPNGLPELDLNVDSMHFTGSGGCNRIFGNLFSSADSIRFNNVASTLMACANMDKEQAVLTALSNARNFRIEGTQLILYNAEKILLVFERNNSGASQDVSSSIFQLNDIWVLEKINGAKACSKNYRRGLPQLEFHVNEMKLIGSGGCNNLEGTFESKGDEIKIDAYLTTRMACVGNFETDFVNALQEADHFKIENLRLTLMKDGKALIVLKKVD